MPKPKLGAMRASSFLFLSEHFYGVFERDVFGFEGVGDVETLEAFF